MSDNKALTANVIDGNTGEILEGFAPALENRAASGVEINGVVYDTVKAVTLPTLKHDVGKTIVFKVAEPMFTDEKEVEEMVEVEGVMKKGTRKNKVTVMRVIELNSGVLCEYVCNAITVDDLNSAYPDNGYVGKSFAVQKLGKIAGKKYNEIKIIEIQPRVKTATVA